jgi:hypothetical protein
MCHPNFHHKLGFVYFHHHLLLWIRHRFGRQVQSAPDYIEHGHQYIHHLLLRLWHRSGRQMQSPAVNHDQLDIYQHIYLALLWLWHC